MDASVKNKVLRVLALVGMVLSMLLIERLKQYGCFVSPDDVVIVASAGFVTWVANMCHKKLN